MNIKRTLLITILFTFFIAGISVLCFSKEKNGISERILNSVLFKKDKIPKVLTEGSKRSGFVKSSNDYNLINPEKAKALTAKEKQWLRQHPKITITSAPNAPPINFFDADIFNGISADYLSLIEKKLGIKFEYINCGSYPKAIEQVTNRKIDVISGITPTPFVFKSLDFSMPYLELPPVILVRKDSKSDVTLGQLSGLKVAVVSNYAIGGFIKENYPSIKLEYVPDSYTGLTILSTGGADAMVIDMAEASYCIEHEGITNLRVGGKTDYVNRITFGVRKDWSIFVSILNKALARITDAERGAISEKWTSFGVKNKFGREFWVVITLAFGVMLSIFILIIVWNRALKRQVIRRTKELMVELNERLKAEEELSKYRDQLEVQVKVRTANLQDANKRLTKEISEREKIGIALRENEMKYKSLFESAYAAILIMDEKHFIDCNAIALKMFNCKRKDIIGKPVGSFSYDSGFENVSNKLIIEKIDHVLKKGKPLVFEWRIKRLDSTVFDALISLNRVMLGSEYVLQTIINDITVQKKAQDELNKAKEIAETANMAKSVFLANMSHEIRTPMNAILGFTQLMFRNPGLDEQQKQNLEIINRSGEHLLGLINQILEMSKIEAGNTTLDEKPYDLTALLGELEFMFKLRAETKALSFTVSSGADIPNFLFGDDGKLRQVLVNLIGNSMKFTQKGGVTLRVKQIAGEQVKVVKEPGLLRKISKKIGFSKKNNNKEQGYYDNTQRLYFEVEDSGLGIAKNELAILFSSFGQTDSGKKSGGGSGLGLSISQEYVKLMGGEIHVSSEVNKKTIFYFSIPLKISTNKSEIKKEKSVKKVKCLQKKQKQYRILVVEDEKESSELLLKLLESVGFIVKIAVNGEKGVEYYESWRPNLILMDLRMPVMNGYQATEIIRSAKNGKKIPIIALSANVYEEDYSKAIAAGCDEFIRKPFKEEELFDIIRQYLKVKYEYVEIADINVSNISPECFQLTQETLQKTLPEVLIKKMEQAVQQADFDLIMSLIEEVKCIDDTYHKELHQLAENYEYDKLLHLLKKQEIESVR